MMENNMSEAASEIAAAEVREVLMSNLHQTRFTRAIVRAYCGRPGCGCGCRGKYTNSPAEIKEHARHAVEDLYYDSSASPSLIEPMEGPGGHAGGVAVETSNCFRWFFFAQDGQ